MTESTTVDPTPAESTEKAPAKAPRKSGGALGGKVIAELQEIAAGLGIAGAEKLRKGQLIDAIKAARGEAKPAEAPRASEKPAEEPAKKPASKRTAKAVKSADDSEKAATESKGETEPKAEKSETKTEPKSDNRNENQGQGTQNRERQGNQNRDRQGNQGRERQGNQNQGQGNQNRGNQNQNQGQGNQGDGDSRRRNRRGRNRNNRGLEVDPTFTEDDVLVPAAGILDIQDNYAFVRTTGYLPSENDVYVSMSLVRKLGLRRGDAIVGQVRQPREGERKEKFNPMVKVDSVNGMEGDEAKRRVEFSKLTPLYPSERLRLESQAGGMTGRVIDLVSPIGKGQRGLIVSPPKAGKTMVMQQVANAITENNPECHLMIVLVDERPEEVTDFQRTVNGEVIASTFDRPASDHTAVAELAIERAKRLVELGHDVVVLLDGITRLGRAYNLAAPASGRIMSGGVDSSALYPPKKFFGAARNIEDGGSLTILATALIETGSRMDEVIFEEFKGTGNWELRLRREFADKRIFPAIDVEASSTRREELLMARDELAIIWKLRRLLSGLEGQQGLELVLGKLKKTQNNVEFLMEINKTMPGGVNNGDD